MLHGFGFERGMVAQTKAEEATMARYTQESLGRVRAIVMVVVGALILLAYVITRVRGL
jgi:hypothetical protein